MGTLAQTIDRYSREWWGDFAIRTGVAVAVAIAVSLLSRLLIRRMRRRAAEVEDQPAEEARRRRAVTMAQLVGTTLQVIAWFTALLVMLSALGVPLGPLFASAGIAGIALGFGAQTVVRDTLAGLFIALEGQFDVGDTVDLQTEGGLVSGTIEGLTLRVTTVRQYDGTLSVVPNGSIQITSNKTRGWGRAIVDVRVALSEDPDKVRDVLAELFDEVVQVDPLKGWLRQEPKVLGVTQLTDAAQVIRVVAETQPNHRLDTERLLRERIAMRITDRGIQVPPVMPAVQAQPAQLPAP